MSLFSLRRWRVSLGGLAWLAAVWVLLWGALNWGNVLGGLFRK